MDAAWWERHIEEVRRDFQGVSYSSNDFPAQGIVRVKQPFKAFGNSGAGAIALAAKFGAKRIILLGYDCQHTGGMKHWHGDHPAGLGNAGRIERWPDKFKRLAATLEGVEVINCSRATALTVFPRGDLESALCP
jgi:uncharacterized Rossmann fold enzyme